MLVSRFEARIRQKLENFCLMCFSLGMCKCCKLKSNERVGTKMEMKLKRTLQASSKFEPKRPVISQNRVRKNSAEWLVFVRDQPHGNSFGFSWLSHALSLDAKNRSRKANTSLRTESASLPTGHTG